MVLYKLVFNFNFNFYMSDAVTLINQRRFLH